MQTISGVSPGETPSVIKSLIFTISFVTILSALLDPWIPLSNVLALSRKGISQFFLWQPISYLFLDVSYYGLHFSLLLNLFFQMLFLWILGTAIVQKYGSWPFLRLFFLSGILSALATLPLLFLSPSPIVVAGCLPAIFALFTAWTMMHPEVELLLFFLFPIKTKWLFAGILGATLLVAISQANSILLLLTLTGCLTGYLYGTLSWQLQTPFSFTHSLDNALADLGSSFRFSRKKSDKITPLPSAKEEDFIDTMLTKISKQGEHSLTWRERRRLHKISEKRKKR